MGIRRDKNGQERQFLWHHDADEEHKCEIKFELNVRNTDDSPLEVCSSMLLSYLCPSASVRNPGTITLVFSNVREALHHVNDPPPYINLAIQFQDHPTCIRCALTSLLAGLFHDLPGHHPASTCVQGTRRSSSVSRGLRCRSR